MVEGGGGESETARAGRKKGQRVGVGKMCPKMKAFGGGCVGGGGRKDF